MHNVLHLVDTLEAAGKERVAVNLANLVQHRAYKSYLCATRKGGILRDQLGKNVEYLELGKKNRFNLMAVRRLVLFISRHKINILHAHNASLFIAAAASMFPPYPVVLWHDHYVTSGASERPVWLYRFGVRRARGIIAVSEPLADWIRVKLRVPAERVWYLPNFVNVPSEIICPPALPGIPHFRIVCVAHFRPQKDHITLIRAMRLVVQEEPRAHLILIGGTGDMVYYERVKKEISVLGLKKHISILGEVRNIWSILKHCRVGVLSSAGEGFPLVLLEYGISGIPVVAPRVGQCAEILDNGSAGLLVPSRSPMEMADSILMLLKAPELCSRLSNSLKRRVDQIYSSKCVGEQLCRIYDAVLRAV
jgi:glycosyltransferase involved in cell wall biosynthesis